MPYKEWIDCDFPDVIEIRRKYYEESDRYRMMALDASDSSQVAELPARQCAIVVLEGISMYIPRDKLRAMFGALECKYRELHVMMDVYTEFGVKASKYKNPVNDVGVTTLYGIDDIGDVVGGLRISYRSEHSFTPPELIGTFTQFSYVYYSILRKLPQTAGI